MEKNGQTVRVLDEQGTVIGYTYPKRAKGLVKKCRAEFVSDQVIRLYKQCPTYENMEDKKMDNINYITINPKEWRRNPDGGSKTVCDRFMINNPLDGAVALESRMTEVLSVGTFSWDKGTSYVTNGFQALEPNTEYHFVFWLNGGENDRSDETCELQILFTDDNVTASIQEFGNGLRFRLNRGYIKPLKKYNGWEYYDIPFTTTLAKYTQFQFVANRAPMAVIPAKRPDAYDDLQDLVDPYEKQRPQRHNIVFEDGWPVNQWYSTERLAHSQSNAAGNTTVRRGPDISDWKADIEWTPDINWTPDIQNEIVNNLDVDSLRDEIMEAVLDELDVVSLRDEIMKNIKGTLNNPSE